MILITIMLITALGMFMAVKHHDEFDGVELTGTILAAIGVICLIIAVGIAGVSHIQIDAQEQALLTQQEAIEYKIDSGLYTDEFGLLDKDVVTEAMNWNSDLIQYKAWQRDMWIGVFIPNIYDDLELIDYNRIKAEVSK